MAKVVEQIGLDDTYIRPPLVKIKDAVLDRVKPVSADDVQERVRAWTASTFLHGRYGGSQYPIYSNPFETQIVAREHGVKLQGLDLPGKYELVNLYDEHPVRHCGQGPYMTVCYGLRMVEGDHKWGSNAQQWLYASYPEDKTPDMAFEYPDGGMLIKTQGLRMNFPDDVTCFAKAHLILPGDAGSFMLLNPIQFSRFVGSGEKLRDELSESGGHNAQYRKRVYEQANDRASIFRHMTAT